jgi:predicted Zn-dependent protease
MKRTLTAALAAVLLAFGAAAKQKPKLGPDDIGSSDPGKGVNLYSMDREIAIGRQMAQEVDLESRLCDDPVVTEYVNRLGQNLARNSDARVPFTIKVIDSDEVNAFALPGGFLFVNTGLVRRADNEAELAGVLAHEIAHVAARHGTKQATRGELIQYGMMPLVFFGGETGYLIYQAASLAMPIEFQHFSRGMEMQADQLGLEYMYKTGYDPVALVDFFEKIGSQEKRNPGLLARAFSSHPMTGARIRNAQKVIQNDLKPEPEYVLDTSEFQKVRNRLEAAAKRRKAMQIYYLPELRTRPDIK